MSTKKSTTKHPIPEPAPTPEVPQLQETPLAEEHTPTPEPETPSEPVTSTPEPEKLSTIPITLETIQQELQSLTQLVSKHTILISQLQETLARKRKPPVSNGKIQIRDKQTGMVYPSKNNAYQSLLKSGELQSLVDKGVFGHVPEKNTFGWYVLVREWPDRFEEVNTEEKQA